jgi:hypothetical protein
MCKEEHAKAINKAIFPGTQGGPLMHIIAAKAVCFGEALKPEQSRFDVPAIEGATPVFPVRDDGVEMNWGITGDSLQQLCKEGVVRVSPGSKNQPYVFRYLSANYVDR